MKRFKWSWFLGFAFLITVSMCLKANASEVDLLVKKLAQKGLITDSEAKDLLGQLSEEKEKDATRIRQQTKQVAQEEVKANGPEIPKWLKGLSLKGDLRLRYQTEDRDGDTMEGRDRYRFRWRLGMENKINEQWLAGFGLCSGGADPRSTNQTFQDTFQSPDARIDYAFINYSPLEWLTMTGGKYKNTIWEPKDLLWDTDIMPDGISAIIKPKLKNNINPWFSASAYVLDEYSSDSNDPYMFAIQAGLEYIFLERGKIKFAPTYYNFSNIKDNSLDHRPSTVSNTVKDYTNNKLIYEYNSLALGIEISYELNNFVQKVSLFGEYVNSDATTNDTGYLIGFALGSKKLEKFGDWELRYNWRRLEKDAWMDVFPDSDFCGGTTNVKGHEVEFTFGLAKYVTVGLDYYRNKPIDMIVNNITNPLKPVTIMDPEKEETLLQLDLVVRW